MAAFARIRWSGAARQPESPFAPRKAVLSRSERRRCDQIVTSAGWDIKTFHDINGSQFKWLQSA